jgi:hypothetical protein
MTLDTTLVTELDGWPLVMDVGDDTADGWLTWLDG